MKTKLKAKSRATTVIKTKKIPHYLQSNKMINTNTTLKELPPTLNPKNIAPLTERHDREFGVEVVSVSASSVTPVPHTLKLSVYDEKIKAFTDLKFKLDVSFTRDSSDMKALDCLNPDSVKPFNYKELAKKENTFRKLYVDKKIVWPKYYTATKQQKDIISAISTGFARGISKYVNEKYKKYNISNAFVKLWEIYNTFDWLLPKDKAVTKMFHMAEAPGQWINTTNVYFGQHMPTSAKYEWYANSLNAEHPKIKGIINAFKNDYGLIKKYKDRWIWGADDTGDITSPENIRWYGNYIAENMGSVDIVTGDAGLSLDNPSLSFLQNLELAQMVMVACTATPGCSCIIKHFLPFIPKIKESVYASGFFMSFMYMYQLMFKEFHMFKPLSSNPGSGEFYVVATGFLELPENLKNKLLASLDKFKVNKPIFEKKDIPKEFVKKVIYFINSLVARNIDSASIELEVIKCIRKKPTKLDCKYYFGPEFKTWKAIDLEEWLTKYKLNLNK